MCLAQGTGHGAVYLPPQALEPTLNRRLFGEKNSMAVRLSRISIAIETGSSNPSVTREIGPQMKEAVVDFIDAPLSGGVTRAIPRYSPCSKGRSP